MKSPGTIHVTRSPGSTEISSGNGKNDPEGREDGLFHQIIDRDGEEVLVSWTKDEEERVVRKADFLFLPLFSVRMPHIY